MSDDFQQGTWDGAPAFCPICGIVGTTTMLMLSVNSLLFFCANAHTFSMQDMTEITDRYGHASEDLAHKSAQRNATLELA